MFGRVGRIGRHGAAIGLDRGVAIPLQLQGRSQARRRQRRVRR